MHNTISKLTRAELLEALRERYQQAPKSEKTKVLDEFVAVAGCHRKHAIRLLTTTIATAPTAPAVAQRTYDEAVREALVVLWEAADRICGKRLKAVLPDLVASLEQHGHLALDPTVRQRLLAASAATIDRLLAPVRGAAKGRKKRKKATKPSQQVPIRTFADWNEPPPGYLEIDFVSHGGSSMQGTFLWSLVATDVCLGWIEVVPLLAREQSLVTEGLEVIRRQFPVPVLGIDSDNDGAFINDTLLAYCREQHLEFTRSRPYQKNDQAWIEQKNGAVVRRFVGYDRLTGVVAGQCLAGLFQAVRLFVNYFQPSFKLRSKTREGAKVKKRYYPPRRHARACWRTPRSRKPPRRSCGPRGTASTPWSCCTTSVRARRLLLRWGQKTGAVAQGGRAWSNSWRNSRGCGRKGKRGRRIGKGQPGPMTGGRGRTRSRGSGRRSSWGCRRTPRPPPSRCSSGSTAPTRADSPRGSCGRCAAESGSGGG